MHKTTPKPALEKEIMKSIMDWLEYQGCLVIRLNNIPVPLGNGKFIPVRRKGLPDLLCYIPRKKGFAVPVMIEVKSKKGKLSPEQEQFLGDADHKGIVCIEARSLEFVQERLKKYF